MAQVREYARITANRDAAATIDCAVVSQATFDWLCERKNAWCNGDPPLRLEGPQWLKLDSYVGYIESPLGESIEILPKTQQAPPSETSIFRQRRLLRRMLLVSMGIPWREAGPADLMRLSEPLHEWILTNFLRAVAELVRRGIRFDYQMVEEESRYLRGRLNLKQQVRQRPGRETVFHVRHDRYQPDIVENRLIATALKYAKSLLKAADNWRLANELSFVMADIRPLDEPVKSLHKWRTGKLMKAYDNVRPWCRLVIEQLNPQFQKGEQKGVALLFPMERLFESYVGAYLRKLQGVSVWSQPRSEYLVRHRPTTSLKQERWFQLKPDFLVRSDNAVAVLDAKWKLLDENLASGKDKYGIAQSDIYQLFAYGEKYLKGVGHMGLIYPKHREFTRPLPGFSLGNELHLWAIPFDLERECLLSGEWETFMPYLGSCGATA